MIKVLEYKEIRVNKAIIIQIPKDVEVIIRKKNIRRNIFRIIKDAISVSIRDSYYKDIAMNQVHERIIFK